MTDLSKVNVLMVGTGEYTTGYVGGAAADSDKGAGVVALTMFDLRRRSKVDRVGMCGVNGTKFPGIRNHMSKCIGDVYADMDLTCDTFPGDDEVDPNALAKAAAEKKVLVAVEVHKRLDPFYADARDRARAGLGNFQYLYAYMSQPKFQLDTFKAWAGKSSDISYYLNSHHVDFSEWTLAGIARPVRVTATASTGVAIAKDIETEDSITLTVQWQNFNDKTLGCAVYTSSWVAPKSDVHSQQRFFYMGTKGEINVDQAHRGCTVATDSNGFASVNPLFMKYTPTNGKFSGQSSYGVKSFENFIDACRDINAGKATPDDFNDGSLATVHTTMQGTAILEAGRRSLDADGQPMDLLYEGDDSEEPIGIQPHLF
ncbi:oxidoreductase [Fragilaria crotonensis]|nr:oxidoreductase [Fragilaria crotonensis]